ncbi:DUF3693 domain-containing protein [Photobacterium kishitanii]|uniref:DUF3693 domain-containing protein n=1 Tax=Photobacterium kishitanii TaxID=318456 RepID=UPI00071AEBAA|nr:DUF3693 domain-containing protein [Photobacterium kishitanii]
MHINKLLDAYKEAKNYVQDKQIASDLGIDGAKLSRIRKGERYLTENEVIFLAEETKTDIHDALIYLAADKAKTHKAKQAWQDITKKLKGQNYQIYSIGLTAFAFSISPVNDVLHECALCTLC